MQCGLILRRFELHPSAWVIFALRNEGGGEAATSAAGSGLYMSGERRQEKYGNLKCQPAKSVPDARGGYFLIRFINSSRVFACWKYPVKSDVVVKEFCFSTPRICMHMCCASITTITPSGFSVC